MYALNNYSISQIIFIHEPNYTCIHHENYLANNNRHSVVIDMIKVETTNCEKYSNTQARKSECKTYQKSAIFAHVPILNYVTWKILRLSIGETSE